ncbi:hypothetical protein GKZ90_0007715 [Flavobacterium sp. MC2016-06]|uniref:hypothetical protein n=1 Tax=Flavobacterium sp. MC2016-06 TaxID=2676308 RepID=UPI0012BAA973|nr:hypothetical protein [Flavobacterium sp. MC2016-06]MBU3858084.1 hypothetical protein [Flavobacterium sp. MC2016-06]
MDKNHKITIPKPCHEDWDKMNPKDNGRFCLSCTKTVIDFTQMLPEEIQHYFISNQNKSICGRFKNTQLDEIIIQIPSQVLYSQTQYHKMFLLALFIAMGTTLFSCQDKDGNKQKIDKVEVIKDTLIHERIYVGDMPVNKNDSTHHLPPPPPPPKVDQVKFIKPVSNTKAGKAKISKYSKVNCEKTTKDSIIEDYSFINGMVGMEVQPNYPGGIENFYNFFISEFKRPSEADNLNRSIRVLFTIEKDGSLSSFDFPKDTNPKVAEEITRVLKLSPKWQAGETNGEKAKFRYAMPLKF